MDWQNSVLQPLLLRSFPLFGLFLLARSVRYMQLNRKRVMRDIEAFVRWDRREVTRPNSKKRGFPVYMRGRRYYWAFGLCFLLLLVRGSLVSKN